ncbi:PAS domain S-box protein [bacterium]|nr:PAS domain S-box protein [bacterium]
MDSIKVFLKGYLKGENRTAFWSTLVFALGIPLYFLIVGRLFSDIILFLSVGFVGTFFFIDDWLFRNKVLSQDNLYLIKTLVYLPSIFYFIYISGGLSSPIMPSIYLTVMTIPIYGNTRQNYLTVTVVSLLMVLMYFLLPDRMSEHGPYFLFFIILSFYAISGSIKSYLNLADKQKNEISVANSELAKRKDEIESEYKNIAKEMIAKNRDLKSKQNFLEDQQDAVLNILEDIEEEKEKTQRSVDELNKFKLAVANASDHIIITNPDGIIIYANKAVEMITGFSQSEVIGAKAGSKSLWGGLMDSDFYKKLWDTIKKRKITFVGEIRNIRKNKDQYDAAVSISPVFDDNKNIVFFVGIERDITREKDVDRAKTEFVSLASHQLRTPLSSINWYSEMLLDGDVGKLNDDQELYIKEIYKGNQRMVELVNALLNVSRLELGTFAIEPGPVNIKDLISSLANEMNPMSQARRIKVSIDIAKGVPLTYNADKNLFRIIIQNFLSNAIKYTYEKGKIIIKVEKKGKNLVFSVKDNGYGIPDNQKDKIFTKLFRADNVRQMDTEGTGLGLYIIKQIVEACSGSVGFISKENKGTTFFASLPASGMKEKKGSKKID